MNGFTFEEWEIIFLQGKNGWQSIKASRETEPGTRYVRTRSGGVVAVSAVRKKYFLGWNGKRFADSSELKAIRRKDKALFEAICARLGVTQ